MTTTTIPVLTCVHRQGIVVETPDERRARAIANIMKENDDIEEPLELGSSGCRVDLKAKMEVDGNHGNAKQEKGYSWTQTNDELEVKLLLPASIATSKHPEVKFQPRRLLISHHNETLLDLCLFEAIDIEVSTWTMDKSDNAAILTITMEKVEHALWSRIQD